MGDKKALVAKVEIVDGVVNLGVEFDVIDALEDMSLKTANTVDDALVKLVAAARDNLDWKGLAKELL